MPTEETRYLEDSSASIIENMTEGVVIENAAGYFTFVNPAAAALLGYAPDDLLGKHWTMIVPPDQQPLVHAANERRARGEADRYELELVRQDGTRLSVIVAASPRYEHGEWTGALSVFTDITERKRAEEMLRASEARYHHAAQATGQLIYNYDLATGQIYWAGAIEQVTGYTPEEFATVDIRAWEAMLHPDDRANALEQLERAQQEQRVYHVEYRFRRKDGTYTWLEDWGTFLRNAANSAYRMIGAMKDITERQRAEQALRASEARYRDLVESSPAIIVLHDLQGQVIAINPAAVRTLGYSMDELQHFKIQNILTPAVRQSFDDYVTTLQQNGTASGLMRVQTRAGEMRWLEYTSTLRTEGDAAPIVRAMARDVTELRRAEKALRRREAILSAVAYASEQLFKTPDWKQSIQEILARLGQAVDASRVYIFENHLDAAGTLLTSQRYEWVAPGIAPQIDAPELQAFPYHATGFARWVEMLSQSQPLYGNIRDFPPGEREILAAQAITSIAVMPIFVGSLWWGFIGFDECQTERAWSLAEIDALRIAADNLGSAIARSQAEQALRQRAAEFATLYETAQDLATQNDLPTLLQTISAHATALLHASGGAIFLYAAAHRQVELAVTHNFPLTPRLRLGLGEGMAGRVAQTRQPLIGDDYHTWEHRIPQAEGIPVRASLDVPMICGGELIGVLEVSELGNSTRKFTEDDARLLTLFAAQAASAVHNARLLQQTQQRAEQLTLLYDAVLTLNRALEPRQVIEHLLRIVSQSVHSDRTEFYRYEPASRTLTFESGGGYADHLIPILRTLKFTEGETRGLVGLVAAERTPLYLPDVLNDPRWMPIDPTIHSAFWVPVEREQQLFGVLVVTSTRVDAFSPADQRLVTLFANHVAVALERVTLFQAE